MCQGRVPGGEGGVWGRIRTITLAVAMAQNGVAKKMLAALTARGGGGEWKGVLAARLKVCKKVAKFKK